MLISIAVDYTIQLQSRWDEIRGARAPTRSPRRPRRRDRGNEPDRRHRHRGRLPRPSPLAGADGPGFGLVLVAALLAFACAMTAGSRADAVGALRRARPAHACSAWGELAAAGRGAVDLLRAAGRRVGLKPRPARRPVFERVLDFVIARPRTVLACALALAAMWIADAGTRVVSESRSSCASLPALQDLNTLQRSAGVSGEIDVTVSGPDLADPKVVNWMTSYQQGLLRRYGYWAKRGYSEAALCRALCSRPVPRLRRQQKPQALTKQRSRAARRRAALLLPGGDRARPPHRRAGLRHQARRRWTSSSRWSTRHAQPPGPAAGVRGAARGPAGARGRNVTRRWPRRGGGSGLLAGLAAVGLVLLLVFRRRQHAGVPLVPIALATGWAGLVLVLGLPLNPMSVDPRRARDRALDRVQRVSTARYRDERNVLGVRAACGRRTRSTGGGRGSPPASTAIAGFAVLP